jgi:hypothetical protein
MVHLEPVKHLLLELWPLAAVVKAEVFVSHSSNQIDFLLTYFSLFHA